MRRRCRRHDTGGRCQRKLPIGYFLSHGPFDGRGSSSWLSDLRLLASVKTMLTVNEVPENTPIDKTVSTQEGNTLAYIAGYICKKLKYRGCPKCTMWLKETSSS